MLWEILPIWVQELIFDLGLLFINMIYSVVTICIVAWLICLLIRLIKYSMPQHRAEANIMQYLKETINLYTVIVGMCIIAILVWFNYPQPVIPHNVKVKQITILINANENNNLIPYDQCIIKIHNQQKIEELVKLLDQYTCKRTSNPPNYMLVSQGQIQISVVPDITQKLIWPFWVDVTPSNEL